LVNIMNSSILENNKPFQNIVIVLRSKTILPDSERSEQGKYDSVFYGAKSYKLIIRSIINFIIIKINLFIFIIYIKYIYIIILIGGCRGEHHEKPINLLGFPERGLSW